MSLNLYLLRHGQTALSRDDVFCGSGLDPELTPEGLQMAKAFAAAYRAKPWRAIYSSALRRAADSAQGSGGAGRPARQARGDRDRAGRASRERVGWG